MGFFTRRQTRQPAPNQEPSPPREPPPPKTCVCGATMPESAVDNHVDKHILAVTTAAGHPGRAFDCPLCGPSDSVWGNPGEHPISLTNMSRFIFREHCREAHGVDL